MGRIRGSGVSRVCHVAVSRGRHTCLLIPFVVNRATLYSFLLPDKHDILRKVLRATPFVNPNYD